MDARYCRRHARPLYEARTVPRQDASLDHEEAPSVCGGADCSIEVYLGQLGDSIRARKEVVRSCRADPPCDARSGQQGK